MLTQEEVKEELHYDPETGIFTWLRGRRGLSAGSKAGYLNENGYIIIGVNSQNRHFRAHRLAFLYMTGSIPKYVDHIDRNRSNNKWSNLREATKSENGGNMSKYRDNTSGYRGVHYMKNDDRKKRWRAEIRKDGKVYSLGYYHTKEEAARAYDKKAIELYGNFANLNFENGGHNET